MAIIKRGYKEHPILLNFLLVIAALLIGLISYALDNFGIELSYLAVTAISFIYMEALLVIDLLEEKRGWRISTVALVTALALLFFRYVLTLGWTEALIVAAIIFILSELALALGKLIELLVIGIGIYALWKSLKDKLIR